ncbi:MAG: transposase [Anaerolineae bacterium]|nr:transposase [Anaerolineae bacterium]
MAKQNRGRGGPPPPRKNQVVAVLNGITGGDLFARTKIGKRNFRLRALSAGARIYLAQDASSQTARSSEALHAQQLTPLLFPTYASWLNPIEKLWKWLKQEVLHSIAGQTK